mgnify:CR=1 FL=1
MYGRPGLGGDLEDRPLRPRLVGEDRGGFEGNFLTWPRNPAEPRGPIWYAGIRRPNPLRPRPTPSFPRGTEPSRGASRIWEERQPRRRSIPPQHAVELRRRTSSAILAFSSVVSPRLASPPFPSSSRVCHRPWLLPLPPEVPVVNQVVGDDVGLGAGVAGLVVEVEQHGATSTSLCLNLPSASVSVDRLRICTC